MSLDWTGERFLPEVGAEISFEHRARYIYAKKFIQGKKVLDVPSGEGYGTFELSKVAKSIHGIDISDIAVKHANEKYKADNLKYSCTSMEKLSAFNDEEFDVVTCFEGIEHVSLEVQKLALKEFRRVLKKDGLLIISSPNKRVYSDLANYNNPYHFSEYYYDDMKKDLEGYYSHVVFLGQSNLVSSFLVKENFYTQSTEILPSDTLGNSVEFDMKDSLYFICVCSNHPIEVPNFGLLDIKDVIKEERKLTAQYELNQQIGSLSSEVNRLNHLLNGIYHSRSWKLTSPLRKMMQFLS
jgi:ubiquinone/menaquinone biosynthesis C-methylase UbiE